MFLVLLYDPIFLFVLVNGESSNDVSVLCYRISHELDTDVSVLYARHNTRPKTT